MKKTNFDTIFINDLTLPCLIGVFEHERKGKQMLIINIKMAIDTRKAAQTDDVANTVSYHDIALEIESLVSSSNFFLIESLAEAIADVCLKDKRVQQVTVHIEKPKAIKLARSAAIEITRYQ